MSEAAKMCGNEAAQACEVRRAHALKDFPHLRQRMAEFVSRASTEITPHDEHVVPELAKRLPGQTTVYVAHTPKASLDDVVRVSRSVQSAGLRASPHIVARRLQSQKALREALGRLGGAGIDQALVIAGDCDAPRGPFEHSLQVIESGVLTDAGIRQMAVAGHPEGINGVEPERLWEALRRKQEFARRSGVAVHIATQFCFDPQRICAWVRSLPLQSIGLPVHVGIAGPTSLTKLLRLAVACGVGASLQMATRNVRAVANIARTAMTPEEMIPALMQCHGAVELAQIAQPHFFSFGGALASAQWIAAVGTGRFDVTPDGKIQLQA